MAYIGSCLCGRVSFEVDSFSDQAANCHCTMCRKFHGAAFGTLVAVTNLNWLSGFDSIKEFVAPNESIRSFCKHCGSSLGFRSKEQHIDEMELAIGCFDDPIPVEIDAHIYTNYKACWNTISDKLPQYPEGRPPEDQTN